MAAADRHEPRAMHAMNHSAASAALGATLLLLASGGCAMAGDAGSSDGILPRTTFGDIGLIEMPSADMAPDGQLNATLGFFQNTQRYDLGFQALPWLDVSFRYSSVSFPGGRTYYDRGYGLKLRLLQEGEYVPALAVGVRDLKGTGLYAGEYVAATKRVFDDFDVTAGIGWGRLGSTGTLANPLAQIFSSFERRDTLSGDVAPGQLFHGRSAGIFGGVTWQTPIRRLALSAEYSSDRYVEEESGGAFRPRSQVNVGLRYRPFDFVQIGMDWLYGRAIEANVTFALDPGHDVFSHRTSPPPPPVAQRSEEQRHAALAALIDGDDGSSSAAARPARRSPVDRFVDRALTRTRGIRNIALRGTRVLALVDARAFTVEDCRALAELASELKGPLDTVTLAAEQRKYPITCPVPGREPLLMAARYDGAMEPPGPPASGPEADGPIPPERVAEEIRRHAAQQSLRIESVRIGTGEIAVAYSNSHYRSEAEAVSRLIRVLMADAPPGVEYFELVSYYEGAPFQRFRVSRSAMERLFAQKATVAEAPGAVSVSRPGADWDERPAHGYPRFDWGIVPVLKENYFGSDTPTEGSFSLGLSGRLALWPGVSLDAEADGNVWNDFTVPAANTSTLPHVRSDYPLYLEHGAEGIGRLYGAYHFVLAPGVIALAKAGYLESMYGGAGGEILWQPESSRFAFGLDAYEVWQRDYDRLFGFRGYHAFTGHASIYYRSPWFGLNAKLMAGQYLAGDRGATLEITRRFETGVEIGAYATITDVPPSQFGQGSFDKGIVVRIPLEWALPVTTQSAFDLNLKPVLRDGGQRLEGDTTLYGDTARMSLGAFDSDLGRLIAP